MGSSPALLMERDANSDEHFHHTARRSTGSLTVVRQPDCMARFQREADLSAAILHSWIPMLGVLIGLVGRPPLILARFCIAWNRAVVVRKCLHKPPCS